MDYLYLAPVEGLFHELSFPENLEFSDTVELTDHHVLDGNLKFWSELLNINRISGLLDKLEDNVLTSWGNTPQYLSIVENKALFLENISRAKQGICEQNISQQSFFSYLETISILCKLYSDLVFYPHILNIQNGFELMDYSSHDIFDNCLHTGKNPYLSFVENTIFPLILKYKPQVLFLEGRPGFYNMAVAKLTKRYLPNTHISITRHSSEYYSMNKITRYLQKNDVLFRMVDSVILEYFSETEATLISCICSGNNDLGNVGNILFKKENAEAISLTPSKVPQSREKIQVYYRSPNQQKNLEIPPDQIVDIRLEPYVKCHWNKCTFCGINKKYTYIDSSYDPDDFTNRIKQIRQIIEKGVKYIWFIDEALPAYKLKKLAECFIDMDIQVKWQARCRIDRQLLNEKMVQVFSRAGLTELRMGLESASINVLRDMNKFEDDFSLDLVEQIVALYSNYNISIHFPMIIGFPTETVSDRQKTYHFLSELKEKYPLFTFNINIFQLDVCSDVFKRWDHYMVSKIQFPCKVNVFLGNWVGFSTYENNALLTDEQDQFMREKLYPWMPGNSLVKPHIFYRLSETIRNTLIWKSKALSDERKCYYSSMRLKTAENLTITLNRASNIYIIYNWTNHHYMKGNELLVNVVREWNTSKSVIKGIDNLILNNHGKYTEDDLVVLIKKLIYYGFLSEENAKEKGHDSLHSFYNTMYTTEEFPYRLQTDSMLLNWKEFIPVGRVLDLGIGMGKNVEYLLNEGNYVVGVDYSEVAIHKLKATYPSSKCEFLHEDINTFMIQPASFSLIICSLVFSHLSEEQVVKLSRRMIDGLIPNGCIYICDLSEKDPMHQLEKCPNSQRRQITKEDILDLFDELEIIDIVDSFQKEPQRVDYGGYFGLIRFLGRKSRKGGVPHE